MKRKRKNPNKGIMLGIMALAVMVLAVVVFFWLWCFPAGTRPAEVEKTEYRILLDAGFRNDSVQLQINDSIIFSRRVTEDVVEIVVTMPERENLLMVVRPEADEVSSFDLSPEGGRVVLQSDEGMVTLETF